MHLILLSAVDIIFKFDTKILVFVILTFSVLYDSFHSMFRFSVFAIFMATNIRSCVRSVKEKKSKQYPKITKTTTLLFWSSSVCGNLILEHICTQEVT